MIDVVASLVSLCKLAVEGGKIYEEFKRRKLSDAEKELLVTTAEDGEFYIMQVEEAPVWVRAGGKDFMDADDPAIAAKYTEAFKSLCKRSYIEPDHGNLFRLTSEGFKKARKLVKK
jgi:hypothetical protein